MSEHHFDFHQLQPVPVNTLPPEVRLSLVIVDLENLAPKIEQYQDLKNQGRRILSEALHYQPLFSKEISQVLADTRILLKAQETGSPTVDYEEMIAENVEMRLKDPKLSAKKEDNSEFIQRIARLTAKLVHGDTLNPIIAEEFDEQERLDLYTKALVAEDKEDSERALEVLSKLGVKFYLQKVKLALREGISLGEIIAKDPQLLPEMEKVRYVCFGLLPDSQRPNSANNESEAHWEATMLKQRADVEDTLRSFCLVEGVVNEIVLLKELTLPTNFMMKAKQLLAEGTAYIWKNGEQIVDQALRARLDSCQETIRFLASGLLPLATALSLDPNSDEAKSASDSFRNEMKNVLVSASLFKHQIEQIEQRRKELEWSLLRS